LSSVVRPLPVLYACAGCRQFGFAAPRVARALDERGLAESVWLGEAPQRITGRYPIFSLDACDKRCASGWAHAHGATVQRAFTLAPLERDDPAAALERIAAVMREAE
jgi:uncharacterized metal-binding protein